MKRILLVDDHPIFRAGLGAALADTGLYSDIGEASNVQEALAIIERQKWDIILLDLNLPDDSGFLVLEHIRKLENAPKALVLSMHAERDFAERALHLGASGYATKNLPFATLNLGISLIAAGELFIESEILNELLGSKSQIVCPDQEAKLIINSLSPREREILNLILSGANMKDAAQRLSISLRTAENYQSSLFTKMGARSAAHLVILALKGGMKVDENELT